jgi:hypothetical protein
MARMDDIVITVDRRSRQLLALYVDFEITKARFENCSLTRPRWIHDDKTNTDRFENKEYLLDKMERIGEEIRGLI